MSNQHCSTSEDGKLEYIQPSAKLSTKKGEQSAEAQTTQDSEFFLVTTDQEIYLYLQEIVSEMQKFGCSRAEAVARINEQWGGGFLGYHDLITHELPEHWAHFIYYDDARYWEESEDRSTWVVNEAPPKDSKSWTLNE